MRRAVDASLQRHVMREILVEVARRRPVRPDPAYVLAQCSRGVQSPSPARRPVLPGVVISLERSDAIAIPRKEGPNRVPIHRSSLPEPVRLASHVTS
jgi:hypothetical protein